MSVDINWETLTGGPDGAALADRIRDFIHDRFQQIALPKLIRSVQVHKFDFGTVAPQIILKDICDPLPDFYDSQDDDDGPESPHREDAPASHPHPPTAHVTDRHARSRGDGRRQSEADLLALSDLPPMSRGPHLTGMSNLGYFHLPLAPGLSGTNTPLAAVAGAHFPNNNGVTHGIRRDNDTQHHHHHHHSESFGSISPSGTDPPSSRPTSRENPFLDQRRASALLDGSSGQHTVPDTAPRPPSHQDISPEDLQVVFHVTYPGDVRLSMTAEVFLDFPMPSFVGIPLKLTITGVTFNGIGVLAYIKKRAHLCFLSPDDAEALVGSGEGIPPDSPGVERGAASTERGAAAEQPGRVGGLLEEIKIESEMGEAGEGKQVLKNVGKIEKFILEQVQRIFDEEFVYPSFWTFLV